MIDYNELKTAITDISNICRMTNCDQCPFVVKTLNGYMCVLRTVTPNNWIDEMTDHSMEIFAARGAHLVDEDYIDE